MKHGTCIVAMISSYGWMEKMVDARAVWNIGWALGIKDLLRETLRIAITEVTRRKLQLRKSP